MKLRVEVVLALMLLFALSKGIQEVTGWALCTYYTCPEFYPDPAK